MSEGVAGGPAFYEEEEHLKQLCDFLRSKHGPPVREATLMDKRVHYIKGLYLSLRRILTTSIFIPVAD
jgi:hypothetical protein